MLNVEFKVDGLVYLWVFNLIDDVVLGVMLIFKKVVVGNLVLISVICVGDMLKLMIVDFVLVFNELKGYIVDVCIVICGD